MPWSKLTDMELDDDDIIDQVCPVVKPEQPRYPWGLCLRLTEKELEKLGLDDDCDVGDYIDIRAFACVTSVSKTDGPEGPRCSVELQVEKMAVENELTEDMGDMGDED